jgi:hypothetical protein
MQRRIVLALMVAILFLVQSNIGSASGQTFPVASHLVALQWTGSSFISSYRDGATQLLNVSADGRTIKPFAPSFVGQAEVYVALSPGRAEFPPGDLYLCSNDSIYSVGPNGENQALFARIAGQLIEYIAFDYTGQWGYDLFALTGDGNVWAIGSGGAVTNVSSLGNNLMPEGVTVAPAGFGAYGGDLIVSMENNHEVVAISMATHQNKTLAVFPGEAPERVLAIPGGDLDLYVAKYDQGVIERFGSGNFSGYSGSILVVTEGENGQTGSIDVLTAAGSNITVTRIFSEPGSPHFEGATFAPAAGTSSSTTASGAGGLSAVFPIAAGVLVVVAALGGLVLVLRRKRKP